MRQLEIIKVTKQRAVMIGMIFACALIISGVTFALLYSQRAEVTGNTIQTGTANLLVSLDGTNFATTQHGYSFNNVLPGSSAVPADGYSLYFKNAGNAPIALGLSMDDIPDNPDGINLSKVYVVLTPDGGSAQRLNLQSLLDSDRDSGEFVLPTQTIAPGAIVHYKVQVSMDATAVTAPSASLGNMTLSFSGTVPPLTQ